MAIACENLERVRNGQTAQGFWVLGAGGDFYGYNNNRSIERVHAMLDAALLKFNAAPSKEEAGPTPEQLQAPSAPQPPEGASIVRVHARIRPVPEGCADSNRRVGRDHVWVTKEEVASLAKGEMPETFIGRIARFHLVDNVRGEPDMWTGAQVRKLATTQPNIEREADRLRVRFRTRFAMQTEDTKRGYEGELDAEIEIDEKASRVVRFRAFAGGEAWGASTYTPGAPEGKFTLLIAMIEATDEVAKAVPPQGINWGGEYWRPNLRGIQGDR